MPIEKPKTLAEVLGDINKKYGARTVLRASDSVVSDLVPRISTGVFLLDYATGGGIPLGRFTMLKGDEGTGKTSLALRSVLSAQRTCRFCYAAARPVMDRGGLSYEWEHLPDCETNKKGWYGPDGPALRTVYVDVEGTFENKWAKIMGVDLKKMHLSQPEYAEQAVDIIQTMMYEGVIDLVVLDSVASMAPSEELEKSAEDDVVGTSSKLMNRAFRNWGAAMNRVGRMRGKKPTVIFINQLRHKIGVMFGNPETVPGGKHQLFAPSVVIRLGRMTPTMGKGTNPKPLVWNTRFKVEKNKVGVAHIKGEYGVAVTGHDHYLQGDVADYEVVLKYAKDTGVMVQDKKQWVYTDSNLPTASYRVQADAIADWIDDEVLYHRVKEIVLKEAIHALA